MSKFTQQKRYRNATLSNHSVMEHVKLRIRLQERRKHFCSQLHQKGQGIITLKITTDKKEEINMRKGVNERIREKIDMKELQNKVIEALDVDEIAERVVNQLNLDNIAEGVAESLMDKIIDKLVDDTEEYLIEEIIDDLDLPEIVDNMY